MRKIRVHPLVVDAALAVIMVSLTLIVLLALPSPLMRGFRPADTLAVLLATMANGVVALRRAAPQIAIAIGCTASMWSFAAGYAPGVTTYSLMILVYSVAAHRPRTMAIPAALAALLVSVSAAWMQQSADAALWIKLLAMAQGSMFIAVPWLLGDVAHRLEDSNEQLAEATAELAREHEQRERRAVTDERVRIARELHDVVAHHMSVISVQAGLARYVFNSDPATAAGALDTISGTSREALDEMRRLLAVLRFSATDDDADDTMTAGEYDPAPGLDRLGELAERVRTAGVPVELAITGNRQPLPPGVGLCAYRVIQESLTNVIKHARPATATVTVDFAPRELTVRIADDGRKPVRTHHGGHGLIGMRERARLYGGTLCAGPRQDGGFEVLLTMPLGARGEVAQSTVDGEVAAP